MNEYIYCAINLLQLNNFPPQQPFPAVGLNTSQHSAHILLHYLQHQSDLSLSKMKKKRNRRKEMTLKLAFQFNNTPIKKVSQIKGLHLEHSVA